MSEFCLGGSDKLKALLVMEEKKWKGKLRAILAMEEEEEKEWKGIAKAAVMYVIDKTFTY